MTSKFTDLTCVLQSSPEEASVQHEQHCQNANDPTSHHPPPSTSPVRFAGQVRICHARAEVDPMMPRATLIALAWPALVRRPRTMQSIFPRHPR